MSALLPPSLARKPSRLAPLLMVAVCVFAEAAALVGQHVFDIRPCPWCILQRLIFIAIALTCLAAAFTPARRVRIGFNIATVVLGGLGVIAAMYQHEVAAKSYSCNLTFADKVISALGVETLWPWMFQVTATCAEAAVSVLGVPFEFYSLTLFALLTAAAAVLVLRSIRVDAS